MPYVSRDFVPIPIATFSTWATAQPLYTTEIIRLERWKFLSKLALWHEFVIAYVPPVANADEYLSHELPPMALAQTAQPQAYRDLLQNGLVIRFDRRMPDDFACFVSPEDKTNIETTCYLIDTLKRITEFEAPNIDHTRAGPRVIYRGPTIGDIIASLNMFHDLAPSYNLFKSNCWTLAHAAMTTLYHCFTTDLDYETSPGLSEDKRIGLIWVRSKLNKRFGGASTIPADAIIGEGMAVDTLDAISKAKSTAAELVGSGIGQTWDGIAKRLDEGKVSKFQRLKNRYSPRSSSAELPAPTSLDISTRPRIVVP
ncbi:hypothetical protein FRC09_000222 [Ceratobasidium sp. 395]|nr:hypothetical protein FRC09_000222 [Ceratobasidium sp. 395]